MNRIRTNHTLRTLIVTLTLAGWFVLTNHCALGRLAQTIQAKKEHACCQNGDAKTGSQPMDGTPGMQCCKAVNAVVPDAAQDLALTSPHFVIAVLASLLKLEARTAAAVALAHDTGPPPRAASFSELVLHRSLRSHAPPLSS